MKRCINPECGAELDDNAKFCPECGTKQPTEKKCPKCGTVVAEKAKFCPECGFKMDGTGAVPKAGGLSIGDNNAISAKDVIGGDKIEAQHYTVNNFMAAQKTEAEQKMDNISVKKMSKEYIRDEMNKAMNYEKQGDYYHAVEIYKDLAADDNSDAVCAMLKLDLKKKFQLSGIERNQMLSKISEIANTGHPEALFVVGAYKLETDKATGLQYIYAAAQNHSNDAIDYLDDYFGWNADGTLKSGDELTNESYQWFAKSTQLGSSKGMYQHGRCYYHGVGVEKNIQEAVKCFRNAAERGQVDAQYSLGYCYYNGDGAVENHKEAAKWYKLSAEQGDAEGQYMTGLLYYNGDGVEKDCKEAVKWSQMAVDKGNMNARQILGYCYYTGQGVETNNNVALQLLIPYAEAYPDELNTLYIVGDCYYRLEKYKEAADWFKKAAEKDYVEAQYMLGMVYKDFSYVFENEDYDDCEKTAVKWLLKAAEHYHGMALFELGYYFDMKRSDYDEDDDDEENDYSEEDYERDTKRVAILWYLASKNGVELSPEAEEFCVNAMDWYNLDYEKIENNLTTGKFFGNGTTLAEILEITE